MSKLTPELVAALTAVDTPTICNALELVMGGRTAEGFTRLPLICARPQMGSIVGVARTATLRSRQPSTTPPAELKARRLAYYGHVAAGQTGDDMEPTIAVIEDQDDAPGLGAFWGEVNVAIHKGLGVRGVITNGSIRDLDVIDEGFQLLAGSVSPSHAFVHITGFGQPVSVFGLGIADGDVIHCDRHGAVKLERAHLAALPAAIDLVTRKEAPLLKAARAPGFTVGRLIAAWGEAEDVH
jgi:regulator of RNase E activity RraA